MYMAAGGDYADLPHKYSGRRVRIAKLYLGAFLGPGHHAMMHLQALRLLIGRTCSDSWCLTSRRVVMTRGSICGSWCLARRRSYD